MLIKSLLLMVALVAQQQNDPIVQSSFESAGHTYQYSLTQGMLEESPKWSGFDNPPLSLGSVKALSEKYIANKFPGKNLHAASISLLKVTLIDRWYFVVTLENPLPTAGPGITYEVVVLMNSKIVEPTESK